MSSHPWFWTASSKPGNPQLIMMRVCSSLCLSRRPRYHYYGIAVKESSQYYDVMYSKKGAAWVSETGKREVTKQTVAYSPRSKLGTLLPDFPNVKDLNLPASLPEEKVTSSEVIAGDDCPPSLPPSLMDFKEFPNAYGDFCRGAYTNDALGSIFPVS